VYRIQPRNSSVAPQSLREITRKFETPFKVMENFNAPFSVRNLQEFLAR
jgi:hypothetical protein